MAADRNLIQKDKQQAARAALATHGANEKIRKRNDLVYRGGAKLTNPFLKSAPTATEAKRFRKNYNPNKIKKA